MLEVASSSRGHLSPPESNCSEISSPGNPVFLFISFLSEAFLFFVVASASQGLSRSHLALWLFLWTLLPARS